MLNFVPRPADYTDVVIKNFQSARLLLESAGYLIGPQKIEDTDFLAVRRAARPEAARVWIDSGKEVRVLGDHSDPNFYLYLDVIEVLDGPAERIRAAAAIKRP